MIKEIIIKRIDTASAVKPLLLIATSIGIVVGILMSKIWMIGPDTERQSAEGIVVNSVRAPYMNLYWNIGNMILESIVYCIGIVLVILVCIVLFNLFCKLTGGIKIEVEVRE